MISQIGKHKVRVGSISEDLSDLMGLAQADIFYSDPPWGQGNLNYWETIRMRHTGDEQRRQNELSIFFESFFSIINRYAKNVVIIEYGQKWRDQLKQNAVRMGLKHHATMEQMYRAGGEMRPLDLHVFSKTGVVLPNHYVTKVMEAKGTQNIMQALVEPFVVPGGILLDPCCGLGNSARIAVKNNMDFRGNELNPKRLMTTIEWLEKNGK